MESFSAVVFDAEGERALARYGGWPRQQLFVTVLTAAGGWRRTRYHAILAIAPRRAGGPLLTRGSEVGETRVA